MRPYLLLALFIPFSTLLFAQHSTRMYIDEPFDLNEQTILLIPFEADMYLSDANSAIAKYNSLETIEIIERFRRAVDQNILHTFENCDVNSFYDMDQDSAHNILNHIRENVRMEYELVPKNNRENPAKTLATKFKRKPKKQSNNGIKNGQIVSKRDEKERYMKAIVTNDKIIDSLTKKFDVDYCIFITELDFNNIYTESMHLGSTDNERELKLHYTIYRNDGLMLSTGISKTKLPSHINNINQIIGNYFPILTQQIYDDLIREESRSNHLIEKAH